MRCSCTWCTRGVSHGCTICSNNALFGGKLLQSAIFAVRKYAATRNVYTQQCVSGLKLCLCGTFLCRISANCRNIRAQKCDKPTTYRAIIDTQTHGRRPSQFISTVGRKRASQSPLWWPNPPNKLRFTSPLPHQAGDTMDRTGGWSRRGRYVRHVPVHF